MDEKLLDKFDDLLRLIVDAPGTWQEKKQQVKDAVDAMALSEFVNWFDGDDE